MTTNRPAIYRLAQLTRQSFLSRAESRELAALEGEIGRACLRAQRIVWRWAATDAISARLGATRPSKGSLKRARKASLQLRAVAQYLDVPGYPGIGNVRLERLMRAAHR